MHLYALTIAIWAVWAASARMDGQVADYTGHKLVEVSRVSPQLLQALMETEGLDEWSLNPAAKSAIFKADEHGLRNLVKQIRGSRSTFTVKHDNVQDLIDREQRAALRTEKHMGTEDWFGSYHALDKIQGYFGDLSRKHSDLMSEIKVIGTSFEGRPIHAVHFKGSGAREPEGADPLVPNKIWVQCLIHAREWISGSCCQYMANELANGYTKDGRIKALLDSTEIIMIPVVNPDGYEHSWTRDRLWRKNRHPFRFGTGVDLNRNFAETNWCKTGASTMPFADTFCGPSAGSEPETKAIQAYYAQFAGQVAAAVDVHSFSQLILRPNGSTLDPAPHEAELKTASDAMADAIFAAHGKRYHPKRSAELYPTTGSATEFFYYYPDMPFRPYSVALELRPGPEGGIQGFMLDASEIRATGEEIFSGFMALCEHALQNPLVA